MPQLTQCAWKIADDIRHSTNFAARQRAILGGYHNYVLTADSSGSVWQFD